MNMIEALRWRYAVKKFSDERISSVELKALLDATCLSPSSYGLQPYTLLIVDSKTIRQQLLPFSFGQDKVMNCSHLIVFAAHTQIGDTTVERYMNKYAQLANKSSSETIKLATHMKSALAAKSLEQKQEWAHQQAYIALGNLLTCAALMKIDSCPMTGFNNKGYDTVLKLKEKNMTTTVICPIGRRHLDDVQAHIQKIRFDYHELVTEI